MACELKVLVGAGEGVAEASSGVSGRGVRVRTRSLEWTKERVRRHRAAGEYVFMWRRRTLLK